MDGGDDGRVSGKLDGAAARLGDAKGAAQQGLRRGCSEADDQFRAHGFDLGVEPWAAGGDFVRVRFLVNSQLAARLPLEVLDGIGDVGGCAIDAGCLHAGIEQMAGGSDKGCACLIFFVAGLFANKEYRGSLWACSKNGLRGVTVEVAAATLFCCCAKRLKIASFGKEFEGGFCGRLFRSHGISQRRFASRRRLHFDLVVSVFGQRLRSKQDDATHSLHQRFLENKQ